MRLYPEYLSFKFLGGCHSSSTACTFVIPPYKLLKIKAFCMQPLHNPKKLKFKKTYAGVL